MPSIFSCFHHLGIFIPLFFFFVYFLTLFLSIFFPMACFSFHCCVGLYSADFDVVAGC